MERVPYLNNRIRAYIRFRRINKYINLKLSDKFHMYAEKIKALEDFNQKYCQTDGIITSTISKNKRAYAKLKNQLKKEILNDLYIF